MKNLLKKITKTFYREKTEELHIKILEYGKKHIRGFTTKELISDLNLTLAEVQFWRNEIRGADVITQTGQFRTPETRQFDDEVLLLSFESRFKLLEFEELRQARNSSWWATRFAVIAIGIAVIGILLQGIQINNDIEKINFNLISENNNNRSLIESILIAKKDNNYNKIWLGHFYLNYSQEYAHLNLKNYSGECLNAYNNYLRNLEMANTAIGTINYLRQESISGNRNVNNTSIENLNKELAKYNDWAYGEMVKLNDNKCF